VAVPAGDGVGGLGVGGAGGGDVRPVGGDGVGVATGFGGAVGVFAVYAAGGGGVGGGGGEVGRDAAGVEAVGVTTDPACGELMTRPDSTATYRTRRAAPEHGADIMEGRVVQRHNGPIRTERKARKIAAKMLADERRRRATDVRERVL